MSKTIVFVTNQHRCDRLISAAHRVSGETGSELTVVGVLDCEYVLDPKAVDYLFIKSKEHKATMRLLFTDDKIDAMRKITAQFDVQNIITGMPQSHDSVVYDLWREFPDKSFFTVDCDGELIEVAMKQPVQTYTA
jgi:hypothetical protein